MRFRPNARLDPGQIMDLRRFPGFGAVNGLRPPIAPYPPDVPGRHYGERPHLVPVVIHNPQTGHPLGVIHIDLRDPFGLGHQIDRRNDRGPVTMPPLHSSRTVYTSPKVRQLAQQLAHHHYGR